MKSILFVFLLFFIPLSLFGVENFEKLCNEEVSKEKINKELILKYCSKAKEEEKRKKNFLRGVSWYYLLTGDLNKNINQIQSKIDGEFLANIGHRYLLKEDFNKTQEMYKIFLESAKIPWADNSIQNSFKVLLELYPQQSVKKGLNIWNALYKPLKPVNSLYKKYQQAKKEHKYNKAIEYLKKIIELQKKYHGNKHDIADNYNNIGLVYNFMGKYLKALKYFQKSLNILEKILGYNHPYISSSYNNIGTAYQSMGEYPKALKYFQKSLDIKEKTLGKNHLDTATSYSNIGTFYESKGEYLVALEYFQKSLNIREKTLGKNHFYTTINYNNIGTTYQSMGEYPSALKFHQKALNIREKILSKNNPSTATSYHNIGSTYQSMGEYPKALEYFQKSLNIVENNLGKNHLKTATSYNNIGLLYDVMGEYPKAVEYCQKSLNIMEKFLPKGHPSIATSYNNIGAIYQSMGEFPKALEYFQKSLDIAEKFLGKNHPLTATNYNNMGTVYKSIGDYPKALEYYKKDLTIVEKKLGKNHPSTATSYNNIGLLYDSMGEYLVALEFQQKALNIIEKILGKNHPSTATSYTNIGTFYYSIKKYEKAYIYLDLSFKVFIKNRYKNFTILDSKEKGKYLKKYAFSIDFLLKASNSYLSKLIKKNEQTKTNTIQKETLNNWLDYKGTLFEYENVLTIVKSKTKDKTVKKEIEKWQRLTEKLANLEQKQGSDTNLKKYRGDIDTTQKKIGKIQISLSKKDENFKKLLGLRDINLTQISSTLKKNQLYIDFAKIDRNYYIFTLDKQSNISFKQIDKNSSKEIDATVQTFINNSKKMAKTIQKASFKKEDKGYLTPLEVKKIKEQLHYEVKLILTKLYNEIIEKYLKKELIDKDTLTISPDGLLNFLPFEALYHNGKYLIEDYKISYISSGREFVRQTKREPYIFNNKKMICFGSPDFNSSLPISQTKGKFGGANQKVEESWEQFKNFSPIDDNETNIIKHFYKDALIYKGKEATVQNLMSVGSSEILHLSTHGKFLNTNTIKNPMLKAGLAFSGANDKQSLSGIVTALKISAMDLKDTKLVVLSACESGLGEVQNAEGVMGLPKAFLQAGARNVLMSLWSVSSQKTAMLMSAFYKNIKDGQDYETALRNAKLNMIEMHPYYWSAFIIHGIQH